MAAVRLSLRGHYIGAGGHSPITLHSKRQQLVGQRTRIQQVEFRSACAVALTALSHRVGFRGRQGECCDSGRGPCLAVIAAS